MQVFQTLKRNKKSMFTRTKNKNKKTTIVLFFFCLAGCALFCDNNNFDQNSTIYVLDARDTGTPDKLGTSGQINPNTDDVNNAFGGNFGDIDLDQLEQDMDKQEPELGLLDKIKLAFLYGKILIDDEKKEIVKHVALHKNKYIAGALVVSAFVIAGVTYIAVQKKQ